MFVELLAKEHADAKNARLTDADRNRGWCLWRSVIACTKCDSRIRKDPSAIQDGDVCGFCKHQLKSDADFVLPEGMTLLPHDEDEA